MVVPLSKIKSTCMYSNMFTTWISAEIISSCINNTKFTAIHILRAIFLRTDDLRWCPSVSTGTERRWDSYIQLFESDENQNENENEISIWADLGSLQSLWEWALEREWDWDWDWHRGWDDIENGDSTWDDFDSFQGLQNSNQTRNRTKYTSIWAPGAISSRWWHRKQAPVAWPCTNSELSNRLDLTRNKSAYISVMWITRLCIMYNTRYCVIHISQDFVSCISQGCVSMYITRQKFWDFLLWTMLLGLNINTLLLSSCNQIEENDNKATRRERCVLH